MDRDLCALVDRLVSERVSEAAAVVTTTLAQVLVRSGVSIDPGAVTERVKAQLQQAQGSRAM